MKNKEYVSFVKMIEYIDKAIRYVNGYNFKQFCDDEKTIEIVEKSRNLRYN